MTQSKEIKKERMYLNQAEATSLRNRMKMANSMSGMGRSTLSRMGMGSSCIGGRDYSKILGYGDDKHDYTRYRNMYQTGDIASRVIDAPVSAIWATPPDLVEKEKKNSKKEEEVAVSKLNQQWNALAKELNLFGNITRADKLSGLGRYSILFLGYTNSADLSRPVTKRDKITYLQPFGESNVNIATYNNDITNPRYGLPETYNILYSIQSDGVQESTGEADLSKTITVHHSRVLHITQNNLESSIYGIPSFQKVYNRLVDLIKVVGGSAEMFWLGARPGYAAIADSDSKISTEDAEAIEEMLSEFDNDMTRWLQVQGMSIESLSPQVYNPDTHFDVIVSCISSATGIPKRILTGSESGELASSMDQVNWETNIRERRSTYAEPTILIPLIEKLQTSGQLAKGEYAIVWEDLATMSEKDKADAAQKTALAYMNIMAQPEAAQILGPKLIGKVIFHWGDENVRQFARNWDNYYEDVIDAKAEANAPKVAAPVEEATPAKDDTKKETKQNRALKLFRR